jgi:hypothetical protein
MSQKSTGDWLQIFDKTSEAREAGAEGLTSEECSFDHFRSERQLKLILTGVNPPLPMD